VVAGIPACHGIAIEPADIGRELGWLREPPPRAVRVDVAAAVPRASGAELVWQLVEPAEFGLPAITTQTWREPDGSTWLGNTLNMEVRVDYGRSVITIAPREGNRQILLEGLASVALPLLAQDAGALVIHGAAVAHEGRGTLLTAVGGSGKSSLLMALVARGWAAISEDQCAIDWDADGRHRVWPGPSWVRLKHGVAPRDLVVGTAPRFEAVDKRAWHLGDWIAHEPVTLDQIVFLEQPGGDTVLWESVSPQEAVQRLVKQATWFQDDAAFVPTSLPQVIRVTREVPAFRMRIPFREDWLDYAVPRLLGA
jgi:hypothetical protein